MTSLLAMIALLLTALWISVRAESRLASPAARSRRGRSRRCPHSAGQRRFAAAHRGSAAARPARRCPRPVHPRHPAEHPGRRDGPAPGLPARLDPGRDGPAAGLPAGSDPGGPAEAGFAVAPPAGSGRST